MKTTPVIVVTPKISSAAPAAVVVGILARFAIFAALVFLLLSRVVEQIGLRVLCALMLGYGALYLWDTWQSRRRIRGMADEMKFARYMARIASLARQRGTQTARRFNDVDDTYWREKFDERLSADKALDSIVS